MDLIKALQQVPAISEVPVQQLEWLLSRGTCHAYEPGDFLFTKGDPIDKMQIVIEGKFVIKVEQHGEFKKVAEINTGEISGSLPYSRATNSFGYGTATEKSTVIKLHKDHFREMICDHHELTTALVHTMTTRVREFTKQQQQQEKMMSLGKLSAGLAHELNNPSSAMARSAQELKKQLSALSDKIKHLLALNMTTDQVSAVNEILFDRIRHRSASNMSLTEKTAMEDEIAEWLEVHGIEDGYESASTFVDFGLNTEHIEAILNHIRKEDLGPIVEWIQNVFMTENLVNDIELAAIRISDLVSSIKSYTHMDRGSDMEPVNVLEGITNTLKMLNHKLKQKQIKTNVAFKDPPPLIQGRTGSLNQVWTNIIDNAIDAMDLGGNLEISAKKDGNQLLVIFQDDGGGIPEDIQSMIFDPFFTTKKVGEGTGMGLDIVAQIIRDHRGEIKVSSQPGKTRFMCYFPLSEN